MKKTMAIVICKDVGSDAAVDDDGEADRDSPHSPLSPPK